MRAQLSLPNFVTNQVNVTLDFFPDQPATLVKPIPDHTIEIPTVPSPIQEVSATVENVFKKISELPLDQLVSDTRSLMQGADKLVNDPQLSEIIANANQTHRRRQAGDARHRRQTRPDPQQRGQDVGDGAGDAYRSKAAPRRGERDDATAGRHAFDGTDHHEEGRRARQLTSGLLAPGSPLTYELINTLKEVAITARSARALMQTLERDPNAILVGRPASQKGERQ